MYPARSNSRIVSQESSAFKTRAVDAETAANVEVDRLRAELAQVILERDELRIQVAQNASRVSPNRALSSPLR